MKNDLHHSSSSNRNDEIALALDVLEISADPRITDIFLYRKWSVENGINYLVGIFDEYVDENDICHLTTLGGTVYSEPDNQEIIDGFLERQNRLMLFWQHGDRENKKYFKKFFIRWASQYQHVCETAWLKDAQSKGFVPESWSNTVSRTSKETAASVLGESERTSLLKIIAGLTVYAYKDRDHHGLRTKIGLDLDCAGCHVAEGTLNKHLNAAWELLPSKEK